MNTVMNLDQVAAHYAQDVIAAARPILEDKNKKPDVLENLVTKTLGVLQENGVYASILYLLAHRETALAQKAILNNLLALLTDAALASLQLAEEVNKVKDKPSPDILKFFTTHVCHELDRLLFVKSLYEQVLIYARYGAKALEN